MSMRKKKYQPQHCKANPRKGKRRMLLASLCALAAAAIVAVVAVVPANADGGESSAAATVTNEPLVNAGVADDPSESSKGDVDAGAAEADVNDDANASAQAPESPAAAEGGAESSQGSDSVVPGQYPTNVSVTVTRDCDAKTVTGVLSGQSSRLTAWFAFGGSGTGFSIGEDGVVSATVTLKDVPSDATSFDWTFGSANPRDARKASGTETVKACVTNTDTVEPTKPTIKPTDPTDSTKLTDPTGTVTVTPTVIPTDTSGHNPPVPPGPYATPVFNAVGGDCTTPNLTVSVGGEGVTSNSVEVAPGETKPFDIVAVDGWFFTDGGVDRTTIPITNPHDPATCPVVSSSVPIVTQLTVAAPAVVEPVCVIDVPFKPAVEWKAEDPKVQLVWDDPWQLDGDASTYGFGSGDTGDGAAPTGNSGSVVGIGAFVLFFAGVAIVAYKRRSTKVASHR